MISCTVSVVWSHPVSSLCYTEHGQRCGVVLSDRITTVAIPRSDQLGLRCTVKPNCSGMSARLAGASVTHNCALDICEPGCVPGAAMPFFIPMVHNPLGPCGTWQHRGSPLGEAMPGPRGGAEAHLDWEARSEAEEHVTTPELSSWGGRARSHGTRDNVRAHLNRNARYRAEERMTASELNSARRRATGPRVMWQHRSSPQQGDEVRGRETHDSSRAHPCSELWSETTACVAARGCMSYSLS
jgi:hypothetical protein